MYKGTTPTFVFTFPPYFNPSSAEEIIVTFSSNKVNDILEKTKSEITVDNESIMVTLTQQETLMLPLGRLYCQINFVFSDGQRVATDVVVVGINQNLHDRVI